MRWLCKLITPPNGLILDPFAGTGATGVAASLEGFRCAMVEMTDEYIPDIKRKLENISKITEDDLPESSDQIVPPKDDGDEFFSFGK